MESQRKNDVSAFFQSSAAAVFSSLRDNVGPGCGTIKNMPDLGLFHLADNKIASPGVLSTA